MECELYVVVLLGNSLLVSSFIMSCTSDIVLEDELSVACPPPPVVEGGLSVAHPPPPKQSVFKRGIIL